MYLYMYIKSLHCSFIQSFPGFTDETKPSPLPSSWYGYFCMLVTDAKDDDVSNDVRQYVLLDILFCFIGYTVSRTN